MAFNPFRGFRKQQKVLFAILTIICMITFVLSSGMGRGDALDTIVNWFGGGKQGEVVTTLYGDKVHTNELGEQACQRRLANTFMGDGPAAGFRDNHGRVAPGSPQEHPRKPTTWTSATTTRYGWRFWTAFSILSAAATSTRMASSNNSIPTGPERQVFRPGRSGATEDGAEAREADAGSGRFCESIARQEDGATGQ